MSFPNPPFDLVAERVSLGSVLLDRDAIVAIAPFLTPEHFYLEKHALTYAAMLACASRREPPDLATVAAELRRRDLLDLVGGFAFLGELAAEVPTAMHVEYYARIVERTAVGRWLIEAGGKIAALGFDDAHPIEERLDQAARLIYQLSVQRQIGQDFVTLARIAGEYLDAVQTTTRDGHLLGLSTGYGPLDQITQGMKPGEMIVERSASRRASLPPRRYPP